jgi:hypothetical protein
MSSRLNGVFSNLENLTDQRIRRHATTADFGGKRGGVFEPADDEHERGAML